MNTRKTPITNHEQLAHDLQGLRRDRHLNQTQLAERSGLSRRTITSIENGGNIGLAEFIRLANALGHDVVLRPQRTVVLEELADVFPEE